MTAFRNLHPGAQEHYQDAQAYQDRYQGRSEDVDFYLAQIPARSSVLEYGAGAGRLTIPLATRGTSVTAVDTSAAMLALLEENLASLPARFGKNVLLHQADMRVFETRKRFDYAVAAFHTLSHLYSHDDMSGFLSRAFRHLKSGGRLVFDLPLPRIDVPSYDPLSQVRVTEIDAPSGVQLLTQRWYQPQEIMMHVHYAGFRHARLCSDFSSSPVDGETSIFTVSARRP